MSVKALWLAVLSCLSNSRLEQSIRENRGNEVTWGEGAGDTGPPTVRALESLCEMGALRWFELTQLPLKNNLWLGNSNPLQCSCLESSIDRGAWRATVYGVASVGHH